jgi:uncharacterized LabA/DUF88 family protein
MEEEYKKGLIVIDFDNLVGSIAFKQKETGKNLDLSKHGVDKFLNKIMDITATYFHNDYKYIVATEMDKLCVNLNKPQQFIASTLMKYLNILGFETFNIKYKKGTKYCPTCKESLSYDIQSGGDVKIAIEVIAALYKYTDIESVVLISGDNDFSSLLQHIKNYKQHVERHVVFFENSGNYLLGQYADVHILDEYWHDISKN